MAGHNKLRCVIAIVLPLLGGSTLAGEEHIPSLNAPLIKQADALQYNHQFDAALNLLEQLIANGKHQQQARLMQARILLAQGRIAAAQESCSALMGQSSLTITGTCLLEVKGRSAFAANDKAQLEQVYQQLQSIALTPSTNATTAAHHEVFEWQRQLLAEQAFLLQRYQESLQWLTYAPYGDHPTVNKLRFIDSWLALEQPQALFSVHDHCPTIGQLPEDSIIVRLAAAERELNERNCWQALAADRIAIRVARADPLHTSDLAFYFIHVKPNAAQARHYAQQNYAVAQEPADLRLLDAAQSLTLAQAAQEVPHEH